MDDRIAEEFSLLQEAFPEAIYQDRWVLLPNYGLPAGWSAKAIDVAFFLKPPYPAASPYGIYGPVGLTFNGKAPNNYGGVQQTPPFDGSWAMFSWQATSWIPGATASSGHNMKTWVVGMRKRFLEGI